METDQDTRPLTLGERRVRISFNPNQAPHVAELKRMAAAFIDYCESLKSTTARNGVDLERGEYLRLIALAQTHAEDAAMWAVKAATLGLP